MSPPHPHLLSPISRNLLPILLGVLQIEPLRTNQKTKSLNHLVWGKHLDPQRPAIRVSAVILNLPRAGDGVGGVRHVGLAMIVRLQPRPVVKAPGVGLPPLQQQVIGLGLRLQKLDKELLLGVTGAGRGRSWRGRLRLAPNTSCSSSSVLRREPRGDKGLVHRLRVRLRLGRRLAHQEPRQVPFPAARV